MTAPDSPGGRHSDGAPGAMDAEVEVSRRGVGDELEASRGAVREFVNLVAQEVVDVVVRKLVDDFTRNVDVGQQGVRVRGRPGRQLRGTRGFSREGWQQDQRRCEPVKRIGVSDSQSSTGSFSPGLSHAQGCGQPSS